MDVLAYVVRVVSLSRDFSKHVAARKHVHTAEVSIKAGRIVGMWTMMRLNLEVQFKVCVLFSRAQSRSRHHIYDWSLERCFSDFALRAWISLTRFLCMMCASTSSWAWVFCTAAQDLCRGLQPLLRTAADGVQVLFSCFLPSVNCNFCSVLRLLKLQICIPDCGQEEGHMYRSKNKISKDIRRIGKDECFSFRAQSLRVLMLSFQSTQTDSPHFWLPDRPRHLCLGSWCKLVCSHCAAALGGPCWGFDVTCFHAISCPSTCWDEASNSRWPRNIDKHI